MAYIEKRQHPNGTVTYRARIRIKGMPDESASFTTRTSAKEWARKKEAEMKEARYFPREEGKYHTFSSFVELYIKKYLSKNPGSLTKQTQIMRWWKNHLGKYYLIHITPPLIAELRDQLLSGRTPKGTPRTTSTVNRYLSALSKAFNICIKELGWLKENPALFISRPKENKSREKYLTLEEIPRLLQACTKSKSKYLHTIVLFALSTGARKGEILNLKWQDVDIIHGRAIFRETKNGETRCIAINQQLIDCLKNERCKKVVLSPYVFPSTDGTQPADISQGWKNVTKELGLINFRFHDLRHTAASHLAMSGASSLEIAAILGHKTLAMVKRYSHLTTSAIANALFKMNEAIGIGIDKTT
jgi:integrase